MAKLVIGYMEPNPAPDVDLDDRDSIIRWLQWNDHNGDYSDEDAEMRGVPPLTLEECRQMYCDQLGTNLDD